MTHSKHTPSSLWHIGMAALALLLALPTTLLANEIEVKSKIDHVTVFLNGAQIDRKGSVSVPRGTSELIFEGVSPQLRANTLQVKGKGEYTVLDVKHHVKYPEPVMASTIPPRISRKINALADSLLDVNFTLEELTNRLANLSLERGMITNNQLSKGGGKSDSIPLLADAMTFFRQRLDDINMEVMKVKRQQARAQRVKANMETRLADLRNYTSKVGSNTGPNDPIHQVIVTVYAKAAASGSMTVSYMVNSAGWSPSYDLRAESTSKPVKLTYKAHVYQNTGIDWKEVDLTLSTNHPDRRKTKPNLLPWYLNYPHLTHHQKNRDGNTYQETLNPQTDDAETDLAIGTDMYYLTDTTGAMSGQPLFQPTTTYAHNWTTASKSVITAEFDIALAYSIPSDGDTHLVPVQESDVDAEYSYVVVPKIDPEAFLTAQLTGWEDLNLLAAPARIYFEDTYIGETNINPSILSDTLDLSLGSDPSVVVKRKKLKDEQKEKVIGTDKITTTAYEIAIKNNNRSNVKVVVMDQVPVSQNDEIKVELHKDSKADYNENTGLLVWKRTIKPFQTEEIVFSYSVQHDKYKLLSNL